MDLDRWCRSFSAEPVYSQNLQLVARLPAERYTVVRLLEKRTLKLNSGIPADP